MTKSEIKEFLREGKIHLDELTDGTGANYCTAWIKNTSLDSESHLKYLLTNSHFLGVEVGETGDGEAQIALEFYKN